MTKHIYSYMIEKDYSNLFDFCKKNEIECIMSIFDKKDSITYVTDKNVHESGQFVLLNTKIQKLEDYLKNYVVINDYYYYANTGKGIIQVLPSKHTKQRKLLKHGRFAASFDCDETKLWVAEVFKWIRKNSKKVYRTTDGLRVISEKAENNYYVGLYAAEEYNGTNGRYLTIVNNVLCIGR